MDDSQALSALTFSSSKDPNTQPRATDEPCTVGRSGGFIRKTEPCLESRTDLVLPSWRAQNKKVIEIIKINSLGYARSEAGCVSHAAAVFTSLL